MHCLALQAGETGCRWSALPAEARNVSEAEHRAFWVAVPLANGMLEIIGTVGLRIVGDSRSADADSVESSGLPSAEKWKQTADVGEVRRLRVLPEWRRRGVAIALMSELISWSATARLRRLVLNTTPLQLPPMALDRRLRLPPHRPANPRAFQP